MLHPSIGCWAVSCSTPRLTAFIMSLSAASILPQRVTGKVAVRNIRRDVVERIKQAEKDKDIGKDDSKGFQDDLQRAVDGCIKKLDAMLKSKETDLLKI